MTLSDAFDVVCGSRAVQVDVEHEEGHDVHDDAIRPAEFHKQSSTRRKAVLPFVKFHKIVIN